MAKFRSWNENRNQFYYWQDGYYFKNKECTDDWNMIQVWFDWQNKEQSLEIFDKNNQEIFVGGIVKFGKRYGVVFYNKEQASFDIKPNDGDLCGVPHLNTGSLKYIEIIGHIHEGE